MYLGSYERVAFTSEDGWSQHAGAMAKITEMRGPYQQQAQPDKELFEASRSLIAIRALMQRKRCFLEQTIWKTVPWALEPESKRCVHYLQDILCDLPGIVEDATSLLDFANAGGDASNLYRELRCKIISSLEELYEWRWKWEAEFPNSCYKVKPSQSSSPFSTVLYFKDLDRASLITHYNGILLILLRLHRGLRIPYRPVREPASYRSCEVQASVLTNPLLLPGRANSLEDVAREICRTVEYHLLGFEGRAGGYYLFFPLRIAYHLFEYESAEAKWLRQIMGVIADDSGFELGRHLIELSPISDNMEDRHLNKYTVAVPNNVLMCKAQKYFEF
ncbi:hypothetical protein MMC18_009408 [Xylographa bjoerkii]|nr:hypothetical protein [Xylographa bjoerkii]MCJ1396517.1 hypothetical protein [Xylographa bjoerkii]